MAALSLASGSSPNVVWISTLVNPAGAASRLVAAVDRPRAAPRVGIGEPADELVTKVLDEPPGFDLPWLCLYLFAGIAQDEDLEHAVAREGLDRKLHVVSVSIDVCRRRGHDLSKDSTQRAIARLVRFGREFLVIVGTSRSTWTVKPMPWTDTGAVRDRRKAWSSGVTTDRDPSRFVS